MKWIHRFFYSLPTLLGFIVCLTSLTVMYGWFTNKPELIQILPRFVPMQFNTALCFLLSALGVIFLLRQRKITTLVSIIALTIGIFTLIEYIFNVNFGIDELFLKHYIIVKTTHSGRMAPNTALTFILTAFSLLIINPHHRKKWKVSIFLALSLSVGIFGLVALFGYLINIPTAYGWGSLTGMAVHTSICFLLLSIALVTIYLRHYLSNKQLFSLVMPIIIFLTSSLLFVLFWYALYVNEHNQLTKNINGETRFISEKSSSLILSELQALNRLFERTMTKSYSATKHLSHDANNYLKHMKALEFVYFEKTHYAKSPLNYKKANLTNQEINLIRKNCKQEFRRTKIDKNQLNHIVGLKNYLCIYDKSENALAVLSLKKLFSALAKKTFDDGYSMQVSLNEKTLYEHPSDFSFLDDTPHNHKILTTPGFGLTFSLWPTEKAINHHSSYIPTLFGWFGILFTLAVTTFMRFWQLTQLKNQKLLQQEKKLNTLLFMIF